VPYHNGLTRGIAGRPCSSEANHGPLNSHHVFSLTSAGRFLTIRPMIKLLDQMREHVDKAWANGSPCLLATASRDGEPDIGYKGSMMIFDDESLAYWERTRRQHLKNVLENPKVVVLFRDPKVGVNFRFHGVAAVHQSGPLREQVMARTVAPELDKDPERKGAAVIIKVEKVTNLAGQVLQSR
jgi:predicted pyridoxine 5'-phosphate oxidase superfamily flavin-nucleotide-binding protein